MGTPTPPAMQVGRITFGPGTERGAGFVAPDLAALPAADLVPVSENVEGATVQGPAIVRDPETAWKAERMKMLTASDCAAVLGADPRRGPFAVFVEKVTGVGVDETAMMRRGRRMEPVIAAEYVELTGRPALEPAPFEILRHPDLPWLGATLDRWTEVLPWTEGPVPMPPPPFCRGRAPLELKLVGFQYAREWGEPDQDDPLGHAPTGYLVQLQVQIACTGATWGSLCGLLGLEAEGPTIRDRPRDDAFLAVALPALEEFWRRVERKDPPPPDALEETGRALRRFYAQQNGETVALDHAALAEANELEKQIAARKTAEDKARAIKHSLAWRVGQATFGALPDGTLFIPRLSENRQRRYPRLPRRS